MSRKAQGQVRDFVTELLKRQMPAPKAEELGAAMSEGRWTHDFPINVTLAQSLGFKVSTDLPDEVFTMKSLYPQPRPAPVSRVHPRALPAAAIRKTSRHIPGNRR